jgi:hypothetical protein
MDMGRGMSKREDAIGVACGASATPTVPRAGPHVINQPLPEGKTTWRYQRCRHLPRPSPSLFSDPSGSC